MTYCITLNEIPQDYKDPNNGNKYCLLFETYEDAYQYMETAVLSLPQLAMWLGKYDVKELNREEEEHLIAVSKDGGSIGVASFDNWKLNIKPFIFECVEESYD